VNENLREELSDIPEEKLEPIINVIELCLDEDPNRRPSADKICILLSGDRASIVFDFKDSLNFNESGICFVSNFEKNFKIFGKINEEKKEKFYHYISKILVTNADGIVTKESFGKFLDWFNPSDNNFVENFIILCEKKWFFGLLERIEAQNNVTDHLSRSSKDNFLVRLSTKAPTLTPYVITYSQKSLTSPTKIFHSLVQKKKKSILFCRKTERTQSR